MRDPLKQRVADGLAAVGEAFGAGDWHWQILANRPEGPNVFEFSRLDRRVIGKFYAGNEGERDHLALSKLAQFEFEFLSVPVPIVYDPARQLLLSEPAQGRLFDVIEIFSGPERLGRIGRALRELHESGVNFGFPKRFRDHEAELIDPRPEELAATFREFAAVIDRIREQIAEHDSSADYVQSVPIHRDFHLRQLFDGGQRICVVDWDLCAQGDPAFDVAYFLTYLKTHFWEKASQEVSGWFIAGYEPTDALRKRLDLYENFNYLRRSCRRLRIRDSGWESEIEWMMRRMQSRLLFPTQQ